MTIAEYQRLQDKCDALEAELAELRGDEQDHAMAQKVSALRARFLVYRQAAVLLLKLREKRGQFVAVPRLNAILPPRDVEIADRDPKLVAVLVCCIRRRMGADVIETSYGYGYRLSERGIAIVDEALKDVGEKVKPANPGELAGLGREGQSRRDLPQTKAS